MYASIICSLFQCYGQGGFLICYHSYTDLAPVRCDLVYTGLGFPVSTTRVSITKQTEIFALYSNKTIDLLIQSSDLYLKSVYAEKKKLFTGLIEGKRESKCNPPVSSNICWRHLQTLAKTCCSVIPVGLPSCMRWGRGDAGGRGGLSASIKGACGGARGGGSQGGGWWLNLIFKS